LQSDYKNAIIVIITMIAKCYVDILINFIILYYLSPINETIQ